MALKLPPFVRRLQPFAPAAAIVALALFIAWAFAATTLFYVGRGNMGLPLDDSYIYLTYAKQFGRAQPFTYYPGGGYSAGSTSVLWPMLLAPFWTLGARGHALVWVSFGWCSALYAACAVGVYRFVKSIGESHVAGMCAAAALLVIPPFAFCSLSGMEVAFAAALLVGTLLLLVRQSPDGPPRKLLVACMAAASLSRPEAMLLAGIIVGIAILSRLRKRAYRAAAWWLLPLGPPVIWLIANRAIAGNFFPNTGVAKSHFYLPGFDWTYWQNAVGTLSRQMFEGLFFTVRRPTHWPIRNLVMLVVGTGLIGWWAYATKRFVSAALGIVALFLIMLACSGPAAAHSPLLYPRSVFVLFILGAVRIGWWADKEKRYLVGTLVIVAPFLMMLAVIASSGLWSFQNYRYIAPAFALLFIPVGAALAVPPLPAKVPHQPWVRRGWALVIAIFAVLFVRTARQPLVADMKLFAQGAMDTNSQVVAIGRYIHRKLPGARVMFHDAGAISYYGDGEVYDMLGLVTNHQAGIANNGSGARFEFLESLPPELRPTHFAYYPGWMGQGEFFGEVLMHTGLQRGIDPRRLVGEGDMQILVATWDHAHTGERPLNDHAGWAVVDRLDIADMASEKAHAWVGRMGRRKIGDPTARWSFVEKETGSNGLVIDGGRTIREGGETFNVHVDTAKPTRIVIRTGGQTSYGWHEAITKPVEMTLYSGKKKLGQLTIAPPAGTFSELTFNVAPHALPAATSEIRVETNGIYRVFHWFVLQPE